MTTIVGVNDPKAVKRWSGALAVDVPKESYFDKKFVSKNESKPSVIQEKTELQTESGDKISFDLSMQLRQKPTEGDAKLKGKHENLKFYSDEIYIDQLRGAVSAGGKMTRKRTLHDLRKVAKARAAEWWGRVKDELFFMYLSGARGVNEEYIYDTTYTGFAGNALQTPDTDHVLYGGDATSKATISSDDGMSRALIERAQTRATMLNAINTDNVRIQPVRVDGEDHYVVLMSPFQEHSLRISDAAGWLEMQKAAAAAEGRNSPIFKGGLGKINNAVLHSHEGVIRFSDYGAGANLPAARALFLGAQAGLVAYGDAGGSLRYNWVEELEDFENELMVGSSCIMGVKKSRFNGRDFGVISLDTYAANPN
jgi:N4-gp56 family major capsid protein